MLLLGVATLDEKAQAVQLQNQTNSIAKPDDTNLV